MLVDPVKIVRAGFVGLTDCAPLIVAQELGFDRQCGIRIELVKLKSWTAVRDALVFEKVECAHMPGALSLAMHLGLSGVQTAMRVPLLLGCGGNGITVSTELYAQAQELLGHSVSYSRADSAALVRAVVEQRKAKGECKVRLGSVHSFSSHNYELRAWLAHAGLDPETDVELSVVPRSKMVEALANKEIDGFCVGDPWGQKAVEDGIGVTIATKADLYPHSPEKVLAFRANWVKGYTELTGLVVKAVTLAMEWASQPENHAELAQIITQPEYVRVSPALIRQALACEPKLLPNTEAQPVRNYLGFNSHIQPTDRAALWLFAQMRRWGQAPKQYETKVKGVFEPLNELESYEQKVILDTENPTKEAFDDVDFIIDDIETYWRSFPIGCQQ